jgi:hypothetical protein
MIDLANALRSEIDAATIRFRAFSEATVVRQRGAGKWSKKLSL